MRSKSRKKENVPIPRIRLSKDTTISLSDFRKAIVNQQREFKPVRFYTDQEHNEMYRRYLMEQTPPDYNDNNGPPP